MRRQSARAFMHATTYDDERHIRAACAAYNSGSPCLFRSDKHKFPLYT